jgi:carboxylate-amine ligase
VSSRSVSTRAGGIESELAAAFDRPESMTVGVEEEVMLVSSESGDLVGAAGAVLEALAGDPRFKPELPASQVEVVTPVRATVAELRTDLTAGRRDLIATAGDSLNFTAAGAHPFAAPEGDLSAGARYEELIARYGAATMRRQLVCALHVHVAAGSSAATLPVYNALRSYLPEITALAANAPCFEGRDTGFASVRPSICRLLPRQGVPPPIHNWREFGEMLAVANGASFSGRAGSWWWELRPNPAYGTIELRAPDAQTGVNEALAIAALFQCLVGWLVDHHAAQELPRVDPSWRIAENSWRAARDGVAAAIVDLETGERTTVRECIDRLRARLMPKADALGCSVELAHVGTMATSNGAVHQRELAARHGMTGLVACLCDRYEPAAVP